MMSFSSFASNYTLEVEGHHQTFQIHVEHEKSEQNKKLAIIVHGYMNHCRYLDVIKEKLQSLNYDVLCYDLPGHGNSSGRNFDIDHFKTYALVSKAVIEKAKSEGYQKIDFIAHSTGTVGVTELLLDQEELGLNKIVFIAPLVRSYLYKLSYWSWRLGGRILPRLPVRPLGEVHPDYLEIVNSDPFYPRSVPNHFAGELFHWNDYLETLNRVSEKKIHIFFGTKDTVIDTQFNLYFFETYFPEAEIQILEGSNHLFFHHNQNIREEFFTILESTLN